MDGDVKENNGAKAPTHNPTVQVANEDALNVNDWLKARTGGAAVQLSISRTSPAAFRGKAIKGHLETLDELIDEDYLKAKYGGGKYQLKVLRADGQGRFVYGGQRTVEIAGDPVVLWEDDEDKGSTIIASGDPSLVKHAMGVVERQLNDAASRAERLEARLADEQMRPRDDGGSKAWEQMQQVLLTQIDTANRRAEALEARLQDILMRPPVPKTEDRLVEKLLTDDNARINAIREAHAAELRTLRENNVAEVRSVKDQAREDLKREADRADRANEMLERTHARELDHVKSAHASEIAALKAGYEATKVTLESENRRLTKELEERKTEITELRKTKEKPMTEQLAEMAQLKEVMNQLTGGEGEPPGTIDKIIAGAQPFLEGLGQRVAQASQQPQPMTMTPQQMQQIALQQQAQAQAQGQPRRVIRRQPAPQPEAPARPQTPQVQISAEEVALAIQYIESAIDADQDPEKFAQSIQSAVPSAFIQAVKAAGGFDKFIAGRVQLGVGSALTTQRGQRFIRQVEKILLGDSPTT